jgi:hypothetical protein
MKTLLPFVESVLLALPHSLLLILTLLVCIRWFLSEALRKFQGKSHGNTRVFRNEILKTHIESTIALYGAWYLGAVVVRNMGTAFDLMHEPSLARADLWIFSATLIGTFLLLIHGTISAVECLFMPVKKFVAAAHEGTAQRPFVRLFEAMIRFCQPVIDFVSSVALILVLIAWHALTYRAGRKIR